MNVLALSKFTFNVLYKVKQTLYYDQCLRIIQLHKHTEHCVSHYIFNYYYNINSDSENNTTSGKLYTLINSHFTLYCLCITIFQNNTTKSLKVRE